MLSFSKYEALVLNLGPSEFSVGDAKYCGTVESLIGVLLNNGE